MTYSSTHRQLATAAGQSGSARKAFETTTDKVIAEYRGGWLGASEAMSQIIAAKGVLDQIRRKAKQKPIT